MTPGQGSSSQWTKNGKHFIGTFLGMRWSLPDTYLTVRGARQHSVLWGRSPGLEEPHTLAFLSFFFFLFFRGKTDCNHSQCRSWYRIQRIQITKDTISLGRRVANICEYLCGAVVGRVEIVSQMIQHLGWCRGNSRPVTEKNAKGKNAT